MDSPRTANRAHPEGIQRSLSTQGADSSVHTRPEQLHAIPPKSALSASNLLWLPSLAESCEFFAFCSSYFRLKDPPFIAGPASICCKSNQPSQQPARIPQTALNFFFLSAGCLFCKAAIICFLANSCFSGASCFCSLLRLQFLLC